MQCVLYIDEQKYNDVFDCVMKDWTSWRCSEASKNTRNYLANLRARYLSGNQCTCDGCAMTFPALDYLLNPFEYDCLYTVHVLLLHSSECKRVLLQLVPR